MFRALYAHHQDDDCIDAASGIVTLSKWPSGASDGHLLRVTMRVVKFNDAVRLKLRSRNQKYLYVNILILSHQTYECIKGNKFLLSVK
jgi:hypothetical protein